MDAAVTTLLGVTGSLYEVADHIAGPVIGFGYTNNVINQDVWDGIPADRQQIIIEEGAKTVLEALRLAPFRNFIALEAAEDRGLEAAPFSAETQEHIQTVILRERVIPVWLALRTYMCIMHIWLALIHSAVVGCPKTSSPRGSCWCSSNGACTAT